MPSRSTPETLVLTGASGFVGRHLLDDLKSDYRIFAIARRSQHDCGAPDPPEHRLDAGGHRGPRGPRPDLPGDRDRRGGAGARPPRGLLRLHGRGPPRVPAHQRRRHPQRPRGGAGRPGSAASSSGARWPRAPSPAPRGRSTRRRPPTAPTSTPGASARASAWCASSPASMPTRIARFGAIYSDWCEYPPLYVFLRTWLGSSWRSRIVAGRGEMAVPYIHIRDLVAFFRRLLALPVRPRPDRGPRGQHVREHARSTASSASPPCPTSGARGRPSSCRPPSRRWASSPWTSGGARSAARPSSARGCGTTSTSAWRWTTGAPASASAGPQPPLPDRAAPPLPHRAAEERALRVAGPQHGAPHPRAAPPRPADLPRPPRRRGPGRPRGRRAALARRPASRGAASSGWTPPSASGTCGSSTGCSSTPSRTATACSSSTTWP